MFDTNKSETFYVECLNMDFSLKNIYKKFNPSITSEHQSGLE